MRHLTKAEIILKAKSDATALATAAKAMQIVSMVVLHEAFGFDDKQLAEYVDRFQDTLDYYNDSNDYRALLKEWDEYFTDYCGVSILRRNDGNSN